MLRNLRVLLLLSFLRAGAAFAYDTYEYAGDGTGTAPCNTTLQACIDGATNYATIEISDANLITESLVITKGLTLKSKEGMTARIGSTTASENNLSIHDSAGNFVLVTLEGLDLSTTIVQFAAAYGDASSLEIDSCITGGVLLQGSHPFGFGAQDSKLRDLGSGAVALAYSADHGTVEFSVTRNEIFSSSAATGYSGLYLHPAGNANLSGVVADNVFHDLAGCGCSGAAALQVIGNVTGPSSKLYVMNNTFDHGAAASGPGFFITAPSSGTLLAYLYNNSFSYLPGGSVVFPGNASTLGISQDYNDFYAAVTTVGGYSLGNGSHDLSAEPRFVNEAAHDYRLQSNSPLLNAGLSNALGEVTPHDYFDLPRVTEGQVDVGAIERNADLSVTLSGNPAQAELGTDVTYTMALGNAGPYDVADMAGTLTLPTGLLFKSVTISSGSCSGTTVITCHPAGTFAAGAGVNATIVATANVAGPQTVSASVSGGPSDPAASNDSASVITTAGHPVDSADAGTPGSSDAGTARDGGQKEDDPAPKTGCGCTSTSAELPALGLLLVLGMLTRRRFT